MKFLFKVVLLLSLTTSLYARDIILLENLASMAEGEMALNILQKKFKIPSKLITFKNKKSCMKNSEAIMHLCLKADGELQVVKVNKHVVEETLSVFLESEEL